MLPKNKRLNLKKDFNFVVSGKSVESASFKLFYRFNDNKFPLVGIALSGKNFRKANKRNRARRLTSAAVESLYKNLLNNLNLVIMPRSVILEKSVEQIKEEIKSVEDIFKIN